MCAGVCVRDAFSAGVFVFIICRIFWFKQKIRWVGGERGYGSPVTLSRVGWRQLPGDFWIKPSILFIILFFLQFLSWFPCDLAQRWFVFSIKTKQIARFPSAAFSRAVAHKCAHFFCQRRILHDWMFHFLPRFYSTFVRIRRCCL